MKHPLVVFALVLMSFTAGAGVVQWTAGAEFNVDENSADLPYGKDDVLDILIKEEKALIVRKVGADVVFDGTIVITNRSASVPHPGLLVYRASRAFSGRGTLIADQIRIDTGVVFTNSLKSLKLGYGIKETSTTAAKCTFPSGILFGAWGDWSNNPLNAASAVDVELGGDIAFDTRNCFDGIASHSISLACVKDIGMKSLCAAGGGTVALEIAGGFASDLRRLEVGEDTTLDLTAVEGGISVEDLVLGAGALLKLDASKSSMEVHNEILAHPTARIVSMPPAGMADGELYHLFDSVAALPDGILSCECPDGWQIKANGGSVYLTDGKIPEFVHADKDYAWLGGTSSSWSDIDNWTGDKLPVGTVEVYFARVANSCVNYDFTGTYSGQLRRLYFDGNCAPFSFSGLELKPLYGSSSSQSVLSDSSFPVVISNFVACASDPGGSLMNRGKSYVALVGGGSSKGSLRVRGDIRIGGEWATSNVIEEVQTTSGARPTRLTVLKSGVLTISGDNAPVAAPSGVRVYGKMVLGSEVVSLAGLSWSGSGSVEMPGDSVFAESQTLNLQDGLTLFPTTDWHTLSPSSPNAIVRIVASGTPTLGAKCDWTYGPAPGSGLSTGASARSLGIVGGATLYVDTENPDTREGHEIVLADPIVGHGNVVKKGAGSLVFETEDSVIQGEFSVWEGMVSPGAELLRTSGKNWIRLITARSFDLGEGVIPEKLVSRIVDREDGLKDFMVRTKVGFFMTVR